MLIRYGYEITLACTRPTAMVCLLSVHDDRAADIRAAETVFTMPAVPTTTYRDLFGNRCRRLVAPAGDLTMWGDATIEDDGKPDRILPDAKELAVADLPDDCLLYLMGSRYCETDRLSQIAWDMFGNHQPGWIRVQAICDFVNRHIHFDYMQARATRTAFETFNERVGVCRDFAHLAMTFCRCLNIPARYVNGHLGDRNGHIAKFMGDGVLAYFGWPRAHEDDAERAVEAGLELTLAVSTLDTAIGRPVAARVGIATGLVMVGETTGTGTARERAVVGETPNLAARLQGIAESGTVVVAASTRQLAGNLYETADLGEHFLKGFPEPVRASRVLGKAAKETRFEALHGRLHTLLIRRCSPDDPVPTRARPKPACLRQI